MHQRPRETTHVRTADNSQLNLEGIGAVPLLIRSPTESREVLLNLCCVNYVPALHENYFSVSAASGNGILTVFDDSYVYLYSASDSGLITQGTRLGDVYYLQGAKHQPSAISLHNISDTSAASEAIWHARMCHVNPTRVKSLMRGLVTGMNVKDRKPYFCESCQYGKATRRPFKSISSVPKATVVLGRVCVDLCGPMKLQSTDGERYMLVILDQYTRYVQILCIREKSDAFARFKSYCIRTQNTHDREIKILRADGGDNSTPYNSQTS